MKIISILPLLIASALVANELSWVDEQVNAIKPNRNGVKNTTISKIRSPFVYLKKNRSKTVASSKSKNTSRNNSTPSSTLKSTTSSNEDNSNLAKVSTPNAVLTLSAIINSSALINGDWYKQGEKISNYKILKITKTSVTLRKNKKTTVLSTKSSTSKLKFK